MTSGDKVHLRLMQYSDHADPETFHPDRRASLPSPDDRSAPGPTAEIYRKSIRSHNTWLNVRRKEERGKAGGRETNCKDVAHSKVRSCVTARRHGDERRPASHRGRPIGGRVYSEEGSAREERDEEQQIGWQVLIGALHLARRTN